MSGGGPRSTPQRRRPGCPPSAAIQRNAAPSAVAVAAQAPAPRRRHRGAGHTGAKVGQRSARCARPRFDPGQDRTGRPAIAPAPPAPVSKRLRCWPGPPTPRSRRESRIETRQLGHSSGIAVAATRHRPAGAAPGFAASAVFELGRALARVDALGAARVPAAGSASAGYVGAGGLQRTRPRPRRRGRFQVDELGPRTIGPVHHQPARRRPGGAPPSSGFGERPAAAMPARPTSASSPTSSQGHGIVDRR